MDHKHFYLPLDVALMIDMVKVDIQYLGHYWQSLGRPTLIFPIRQNLLGTHVVALLIKASAQGAGLALCLGWGVGVIPNFLKK